MSFGKPGIFGRGPENFRESLTYEEIVKGQVAKCLEMISISDALGIAAAVRGLVRLMTPNMIDKQYLYEMEELESGWKEESARREVEFRHKMKAASAGCPDLVERPSKMPGQEYHEDAFSICLGNLERHGLLMKIKTEAQL